MSIFNEVNNKLGKWIQILDNKNEGVTIEDFEYSSGVHGLVTLKHCFR